MDDPQKIISYIEEYSEDCQLHKYSHLRVPEVSVLFKVQGLDPHKAPDSTFKDGVAGINNNITGA